MNPVQQLQLELPQFLTPRHAANVLKVAVCIVDQLIRNKQLPVGYIHYKQFVRRDDVLRLCNRKFLFSSASKH